MKKFQINKVKYNVPESWDEITLKQQIGVSEIEGDEDVILKKIMIYCNIEDISILKTAKISSIKKIVDMLQFLLEDIPEKPIVDFEYKDKKFSVIKNMEKEEFQDWISINTAIDNNKDNMWKAIPYIIAILTKNCSLDDLDLEEQAKYFYDLPVSIANRISSFFLSNKLLSEKVGQLFSMEKEVALDKINEMENMLLKQGGGESVIKLLTGELKEYITSLNPD